MFLYGVRSRFNLVLGGIAALCVVAGGYYLHVLTTGERLWGYAALPVLTGAWGLVLAIRQNPRRLRLLGLATAAGVSLGLGFGPLPAWPLQALGFAALLYLTDELTRRGLGVWQQWWYGYHALLVYNVVATWWVVNTAFAAGFVANYLNALLMAVPWVLTFLVRRHMPKVWVVAAIALWIGFEYLHYNWQIAWPWLTLGNALASTPDLAQWYSLTGVFGGSLYLAGAGALTYRVAARRREGQTTLRAGLAVVAWLALPAIASYLMLPGEAAYADAPLARVAAVQPNYEPHYAKFSVPDREQVTRLDSLVAAAPGADLYVLPETSFGGVDQDRLAQNGSLRLLSRDARDLLVGVSAHRRFGGDTGDPALRTRPDGRGGSVYYVVYNSAVAVDAGAPGAVYNKVKRVPGVEFLPYRRLLFFFEPLVASLGGTTAGLGVNDSAEVFRYARSGVRVAPLICYESVYGDYVREFTRAGANLLAVPTNDGWWDDTPGHVQHLNLARLRAIENRRYVVQAANSGVSAVVDARGRVLAQTGYDEIAVLSGDVRLLDGETLYVRYGDQVGRLAAGASCLLLLSLVAQRWRRGAGIA